ncbi:MAG: hypothetical protein ACOVNR_00735, partial [Chitinophagaceae bacterium]
MGLICLAASTVFAHNVDNYSRKERKIKDKINGGVNISLFEQYWSTKEVILNTNVKPKIEKVAALGFKSVRLPVAFDLYLENGSTNLPIALIDKIGETYNYCLEYGLA